MSKWTLKNSFHKAIVECDSELIESWNDVVFLYSKIMNDESIYKKNYLFFSSSTNAPFSKDEILSCLDFAFEMLMNDEFSKSLTKADKINFFDLFLGIQSDIKKDSGDTFSSSIIDS